MITGLVPRPRRSDQSWRTSGGSRARPRGCRPAASGFARREVSLRSSPAAPAASNGWLLRHPSRPAPPWLIRSVRIARSGLAAMNRCAPLPAPRDRGVLRTAAAGRHPRDRARHVRVRGHARRAGSRRLRQRPWGEREIGRSEAAAASSRQCVRVAASQLRRFVPLGTGRIEAAATRRESGRGPTRRPISDAPRRRRRDGTASVPANSPRNKQSTVPRSKH